MALQPRPDLLNNSFKAVLAEGHVPLGTWLMSGATSTAEAMGRAGFDWLVLDLEHVPVDDGTALQILQAIAGTPACTVTRLAANEAQLFKRALDMGAQTVMVPFVNTPEEAQRAVAFAKYPPLGVRGFAGVSRASGYGTVPDYAKRANESVFTIIQIETRRAVAQLEAIARVPGVDALFLGPADLAADMGHIGNIGHPNVQAAIADVARRCAAAGILCGTVASSPEAASDCAKMGYAFVAVASDLGMMMRQAAAFVQEFRKTADGAFKSDSY
jgi:2-dehydro-3-deoxyglucarate aldolase/4-hydroxy-2-oxoheptanedioate aldolase